MGALGFTYSAGRAPTQVGSSIVHTATGVTWTFSAPVEYGFYWNGDPFVVSGGSNVTITAITPTYTTSPRIMHGTVVQPDDARPNGFGDGTSYPTYNASLNVDPAKNGPLVISAATWPTGASVVKSVGLAVFDASKFTVIDKYSILTIVPSTPPNRAFRPPVIGTDKTSYYTLDDLDFTKLQNVAQVSGQKPITQFAALKEASMVSWYSGSAEVRGLHPAAYRPSYNDEYLNEIVVPALMALHSNYSTAQKQDVLAAIVQQGIDYAAYNNQYNEWLSTSTHVEVFPPIIATAAVALGSPQEFLDALAVTRLASFFYVGAGNLGVEYFSNTSSHTPSFATYESAHLGMPEWRITPTQASAGLLASYRGIVSDNTPITALVMEMLGSGEGRTLVNNEAYFDYAERMRLIFAVDPGYLSAGAHVQADEWTAFLDAYHATYSSGPNNPLKPEAPPDITVTRSGSNIDIAVDAEYFPGSTSVTQIDMRYKVAGGSWTTLTNTGLTETVASLAAGLYFVQARLVSSSGTGPWSENRFNQKNTALSTALLASGYITQAEVDAQPGSTQAQRLSAYRATQAYEDKLRAIWDGSASPNTLTTTYVTQTVITP
jgi:hypothetical protein